uniref:Ig-like domain-containing protein n=1 Tax=Gopherus evgoodei TaxID=1825980 RepID=A0A8C4WPL9_9SAUR
MAWAPLLLMLLAYCWSSQSTLTQTSSMAVKLGETAELHCTLEGVQFINDNYPSWYQQRLGKAPRLLIYKSRSRASGIPERFSGDTYGNRAFRAQAEDDADYYCADWDGPANQYTVIQLHREEEQKSLSSTVTQHLEPTCVSLVPIRWSGRLAPS